jgi:eukaryotic-like serine/threonine-protein kinase
MAEFRASVTDPDDGDSLSGTVAGRFQITDRLGRGGMGEVYRAEDTKLKRPVALKRLGPALRADSNYRRRFQEEAQRASRFADSHVAAVYDVVEEQSDLFLVMEYVEGQNLRERLRSAVTLEEFFDIATQCAEALIAAHERRIVHCDIKPENIMLTTAGQVKILDFGVAKHLPRTDQSSTIDRAASFGGTPAYMAPEVLLEKIPDGRSDIFSLGIVFYEALTGHHPFLSNSFVATSERILHETPTPIHIFNAQVPEALEAVVTKALVKDPAQRYQDARALLQDLRLVQAGLTPTKLRPYLPRAVVSRGRRWLAVAVVAAVAALIFFAYQRTQPAPLLTERGWVLITDFDSRGDDPIPDAGIREGLTIALQQSRYVNVFPRTRVFDVLQRMKKADVARIDEALGREICARENLQVVLAGSIEHMGPVFQITVRAVDPVHGELLFAEQERFRDKEQFFEKADDLTRRVRKDLGESRIGIEKSSKPLARVTTRSLEALQLYSQAKDAMDQGALDRVSAPLEAALRVDPDFAMAHLLLASYHASIVSKNEKTVAEVTRAYRLREGVTDRERLWIEVNYFLIQERYEDAVRSLEVLVSLYPDELDYHLTLADAYDSVARPDRTITELRQVLKLDSQATSAYAKLLIYLARSNQGSEALQLYQQAQQRGVDSPDIHHGLGMAYLGMGRVPEARAECVKIGQGGVAYQDLTDFCLAAIDMSEGKFQAARRRLDSIVQRDQASHTKGLQLAAHLLLGRINLVFGEKQLAARHAMMIANSPEADLQTVDLVAAGTLYSRAGNLAEARKMLDRLQEIARNAATAWNQRAVLALRGEIALASQKPNDATQAFQAAHAAYPQVADRISLAKAYEMQQDWSNSAAQWQQVIDSRGDILQDEFPAEWTLARLQLARVHAKAGNPASARLDYQAFIELWRQSDDLQQKRAAERELAALTDKHL